MFDLFVFPHELKNTKWKNVCKSFSKNILGNTSTINII